MKTIKAAKSFLVHYKKGERLVLTVEAVNPRVVNTAPKKRVTIIIPHDMDKAQAYKYQTRRVAKIIEQLEKLTGLDYFWY